MKRSEMVELIHSFISEVLCTTEEFNKKDCSDLLDKIELTGALPPPIRNPRLPKDMSRYALAAELASYSIYGYRGPYYDMEYDVHEWESEDVASGEDSNEE